MLEKLPVVQLDRTSVSETEGHGFESHRGDLHEGARGMAERMLGRKHEPNCDCNIEQHVSGKNEKCNHRYGVKRQRAIEKRMLKRELTNH